MRRRHPRATLRPDRFNFPRGRLPASAYQAAGSLGIPASTSGLAPVAYGQFRIHVLRHTFISRRVPPRRKEGADIDDTAAAYVGHSKCPVPIYQNSSQCRSEINSQAWPP